MLDFDALFKNAIRVRELATGRELDAVQMDVKFESTCPDRFGLRDAEITETAKVPVTDPKSGEIREVVASTKVIRKVKYFDQAEGHFHGGSIRGKLGDYIIFDGDGFFVVPLKDDRGVPVFEKRFVRL